MSFQKVGTVSCVVREGKRLRLKCECGHVAEPDLNKLQLALRRLGGWRLDLQDLRRNVHCGRCGGKGFSYEIIPHADARPSGTRVWIGNCAPVDEETIKHIRERIERCRRLAWATSDEEVAKALTEMADQGEADLQRILDGSDAQD